MAVSHSWFQNWQPPTNLITENHTPFHISDNTRIFNEDRSKDNSHGSSPNMLNLFPFFLSMGIYTPSTKDHHSRNSHSFSYVSRTRTHQTPLETTGPFKTWYQWKQLDFAFPTEFDRERAIYEEEYIPKNSLPLGLDVYKDRLFITLPKWKSGIPCTLAVLPRVPREPSPLLVPYPNWKWHNRGTCGGLVSVFRVQVDTCDRLWILDSGQIHISIKPEQICPPQIVVFDLKSDRLVLQYEIPEEFVKQDSLYSNIIVDIRDGDCHDVHAYLADVWRFGLLVFSLKKLKSWRVTDHLFYPDPLAAAYKIHDLEFEWTDGIFSLALSPEEPQSHERLLYFHPMSSFRECYVKTSIICNETGWSESKDGFKVLGESRGKLGHASAAGMDKNGILFYNLVSRDSIACWDSRKPYKRKNLGIIAKNSTTLVFPNDLKIDQERRPSVWIITNRLPYYLYKSLDERDYNFRIMSAFIDEAIEGTICDPNVADYGTYDEVEDGEDCY